MGVVAAAAIGAVGAVGAAAISSSNQPGAPQLPNFNGISTPSQVNVWKLAKKALNYNAGEGAANAGNIATASNKRATSDLETAMSKLFGGADQFNAQRNDTNSIIEDHLNGVLSKSTRDELGRNMLDSGVTNIGSGPANENYNAYLGLTKEGLQSQGTQESRSLYSMYRQALPLSTQMDAMRYTTMDPGQMVQLQQSENMNQFNAQMALRGAQYQVGYNSAMMNNDMIRSQNQANQQLIGSATQGIGAVMGAYNQSNTPGTAAYNSANYGVYQASQTPSGYNAFTGNGTPTAAQQNLSEGAM